MLNQRQPENEKAALAGGFLEDSCNTPSFYYPRVESVRGRVLGALLRGDRLTQLDALHRFGNFRLAADIEVLRRHGWQIRTEETEVFTSDAGRRACVAEYRMEPAAIVMAGEDGQHYGAAALAEEIERKAA